MTEVAKLYSLNEILTMQEKKWFVIYTKPRWEKKVDSLLSKRGIESWCPVQKIERRWTDRKKIIEDPLFRSYVFVHIEEKEMLNVKKVDGVLNFIYYLGKPAVIRNEEIDLIKKFLGEKDATLSLQALKGFSENDRVIVTHGIFMDRVATITKAQKKKVYVKLESLEQILVVEILSSRITHLNL